MISIRHRLALALASFLAVCSPALADGPCFYGPQNQCWPTVVQINPLTGQPVTGSGGSGSGGGAVYGPDAIGASPSQPPLFLGYTDATGKISGISPTKPLPVANTAPLGDTRGTGTLDATKTSGTGSFIDIPLASAGTVGLRFSGLTASGATLSYFISNDPAQTPVDTISSLNAGTGQPSPTRTTDGSTRLGVSGHATLRIQVTTAGTGSIAVSYNVSTSAGIVDIRAPLPPGTNTIGSIGNASFGISGTLPAFAATPTVNIGTAPTLTVQGTVNATQSGAYTVTQGPAGAAAWKVDGSAVTQPVSGTVTANQGGAPWSTTISGTLPAYAANPTFKIDQTTNGTTNGVYIVGANGISILNGQATPGNSAAAPIGVQGVTGGLPVLTQLSSTGSNVFAGNISNQVLPGAGGINLFSRLPSSAATTNATSVKTSVGRIYKIVACNTTTTPARIKFYNTASAPTPGTTAVFFTRPIPAAAAAGGLACVSYDAADVGWSFSTGIAYALTAGAADADTTAVAAGAITDLSVEYQ